MSRGGGGGSGGPRRGVEGERCAGVGGEERQVAAEQPERRLGGAEALDCVAVGAAVGLQRQSRGGEAKGVGQLLRLEAIAVGEEAVEAFECAGDLGLPHAGLGERRLARAVQHAALVHGVVADLHGEDQRQAAQ